MALTLLGLLLHLHEIFGCYGRLTEAAQPLDPLNMHLSSLVARDIFLHALSNFRPSSSNFLFLLTDLLELARDLVIGRWALTARAIN